MMFLLIIFSFMKFGGQTSKTFKSLPLKCSFVSCVCLACLDVFYVFILGETCMEGLKNVVVYIIF